MSQAISELRVPISEVIGNLTFKMRLTGVRTLRVRIWAATQLMHLAGKVAGMPVEIELPD